MKKILILILLLATTSCIESFTKTNTHHEVEKPNDVHEVDGFSGLERRTLNFKVVVIDSCEYIIGTSNSGYMGFMSHKGNCKYCAERRKRELKNSK